MRVASEIAGPRATLTLFHVIETIEGVALEEMEQFYRKLRKRAEERLGAWAHQLASPEHGCEVVIVLGRRGPEIIRAARERSADLVVLGSHRIDPEHPRGLGTISHQVALFCPCAVLLVR